MKNLVNVVKAIVFVVVDPQGAIQYVNEEAR